MNIRRMNVSVLVAEFLALFFSLVPFIRLYDLPFIHVNAAYFPGLILTMFFSVNVFQKGEWKYFKTICNPLILIMFFYVFLNYLFNNSEVLDKANTNVSGIISIFLFLFITSFAFKDIMFRIRYRAYIENVAIIMSAIVMFQCFLYYFFHTSITINRSFLLPFQDFLAKDVKQYVNIATMVSDSNVFRPSAFFQEPAHFSQYCSIGLVSLLLRTTSLKNYKAIFVSIGIILTTSGLGIAVVLMLWGVSFVYNNNGITRETISKIFFGVVVVIFLCSLMYLFFESFRHAVNRIFIPYAGHYSAIEGRLWSRSFLYNLSTTEKVFGRNFRNMPVYGSDKTRYYMTGIVELLYCQGILGTAIFLAMYFSMMLKLFLTKEKLAFMMTVAYLPYLILSSNISALPLIGYIPFLVTGKKHRINNAEVSSI